MLQSAEIESTYNSKNCSERWLSGACCHESVNVMRPGRPVVSDLSVCAGVWVSIYVSASLWIKVKLSLLNLVHWMTETYWSQSK